MRLIDADAYEKELAVHHRRNGNVNDYYQKGIREGLVCAGICLINAPTIEAEPVRHGSWNFTSCSLCGKSFLDYAESDCDKGMYSDLPNYCPNCGARMEVKEND